MTLFFVFGLGSYFLLMTLIGYIASRKVTTMEEYLVAGRSLPLYLSLPAVVATWFGAGSSMGVSGTVYAQGFYGVIPDPFGCSLALILAGLFFAVPFRRLRILTICDLLGKAYGETFERIATLLVLPFYVGTLASQMLAMGYVFQIVSGWNLELGVFIGTLIVVVYTISGGMWAVTLTDFIQFGLLSAGLFILVPLALDQLHDPKSTLNLFFQQFSTLVPAQNNSSDWLSFLGRIFMTGLGAIMGQDLIQRLLACRSERVARYSSIFGGVCYFLLGSIPLFIGVAGREIYPALATPEQLIPLLAREYLSPFAFTLFACGLFSAIMSTADSYLLAGTTLLVNNILLKIWPQTVEKKKIRLLRWMNFFLVLVALGLALSGNSIFDLMVHSGAMLFVAIFVPASAALFWKGATKIAAWSALLTGIISWGGFLLLRTGHDHGGHEDLLFAAAMVGAIASLSSYLLVSLFQHARKRSAVLSS